MIQYLIVENYSAIGYKEEVLTEQGELRRFTTAADEQRAINALSAYNEIAYPNPTGKYDGTGPGQRRSAALSDSAYEEAIAAQQVREAAWRSTEPTPLQNDNVVADFQVLQEIVMPPYQADIYVATPIQPQETLS